jgi:probable rRNA maturation factor
MTELSYTAVAGPVHLRFVTYLKRWLPKAIGMVRKAPAEISIALVGDTKMAALHKTFMNVGGSTDVLTFEIEHDSRGRVTMGEVVICVSHAQRAAKLRGIDIRHELLLYALHGVLHLSGYDDRTQTEHERMHKEEDRILRRIGIGPVFNRPLVGERIPSRFGIRRS